MRKSKFSPEVRERAMRIVFDAKRPIAVAVGGDRVDCHQDRLHAGDPAALGAPRQTLHRRARRADHG